MTPELTRIMHDWRQLLFVPSSLLCYGVTKMWNHYRGRHWHTALETGLAPIGAGLILAEVFAIFRVAGAGLLSWVIAGLVAAILAWRAAQPADPARRRRRRLRPRARYLPNKLMPELERTKPGAPFMP